jgi:hypothetical protein
MIVIEDLKASSMSGSAADTVDEPGRNVAAKSGLNRSILDQGWHEMRRHLPCGRIVEIFGTPSAGKTFVATRALVAAQKKDGVAVFFDHENSFDVSLAEINGLETDPGIGNWVYKQPDTCEDSVSLTGSLLQMFTVTCPYTFSGR